MPEKNWKFSVADMQERPRWDDYIAAYEEVFNHSSTEWAPWYIVPADHPWFTRLAVASVLSSTLKNFNLAYPVVSDEQKQALAAAVKELEAEAGLQDAAVVKAEAKAAADPLAADAGSAAAKASGKSEAKKRDKKKVRKGK